MKDLEKRVSEMEAIYNKEEALLKEVKHALEALREHQREYERLKDYYGSEAWLKDREVDLEIPAGIHSEDLVFNLIGEHYYLALQMLEDATEMLRNH